MDKRILKKISKEWCKGILLACGSDSFGDAIDEGLLTEEEVGYIVQEAHKLADRIIEGTQVLDATEIVKQYYEV